MENKQTEKKEPEKKSKKVTWKKKKAPTYKEIMNKYYNCLYKPTNAVVKQQMWQQKQIDELFKKGRPIFGQFDYEK